VPYYLRRSLYRDNRESKWIDIISEYEDVFDHIDIRPPKIIVGISITVAGERAFPSGAWTVPAVLDTGLNRALEIDERHLERWAGIKKSYLRVITPKKKLDDRSYETCLANIWLHRSTYTTPKSEDYKDPLLLQKSDTIRVIVPSTPTPWPRLPLVGLQALLDNNLHLKIDSRAGTFVISNSRRYFVRGI
jgi:hypothetical protein